MKRSGLDQRRRQIAPCLTSRADVGAMVHDWRVRGRPHKVYVVGLILLIAQPIVTVMIAGTDWWLSVAESIEGLGG